MALYGDSFQNLINLIENDLELKWNMALKGFALIGLYYVTKNLVKFTYNCYTDVKTYGVAKVVKTSLLRYGDWAVVTGCEDDIAIAFAKELTLEGLNVILVGTDVKKMSDTQHLLKSRTGEIERVCIDYKNIPKSVELLNSLLGNKNVGMLVNNINVVPEGCKEFGDIKFQEISEFLRTSVECNTLIYHSVLSHMAKKGIGAVVTVFNPPSSFFSPLQNMHYAALVYVSGLVDGLKKEYHSKGIIFHNLTPLNISAPTNSETILSKPFNLFSPSPSHYAREALTTLDWTSPTTGYKMHQLQMRFFYLFPFGIRRCFLNYLFRLEKGDRTTMDANKRPKK